MLFSDILKALIQYNNLTQKKVSELTKIPQYRISKYCCFIQEPSLNDIKTLANFFEINTNQLLGLDRYFNTLLYIYQQCSNMFDFGDKAFKFPFVILKDIIRTREVLVFETDSFEEVVDIDIINQLIILKNKKLKFKDYMKVWTIGYDR